MNPTQRVKNFGVKDGIISIDRFKISILGFKIVYLFTNFVMIYFKGLYQRAEALYQMGHFEHGLIFFHRGHRLRPELDQFRLGIQKCQEAIENSVGSKLTLFS